MAKKNWKENKVVRKIYKLREDYNFKLIYGSCCNFGHSNMEDMYECGCCGTLILSSENIHHKLDEYKVISICDNCSYLFRNLPVQNNIE